MKVTLKERAPCKSAHILSPWGVAFASSVQWLLLRHKAGPSPFTHQAHRVPVVLCSAERQPNGRARQPATVCPHQTHLCFRNTTATQCLWAPNSFTVINSFHIYKRWNLDSRCLILMLIWMKWLVQQAAVSSSRPCVYFLGSADNDEETAKASLPLVDT